MAVTITKKAYKKIEAYGKAMQDGEIGGMLLGKVDVHGDIKIKDAILLEQTQNETHFEINNDAMMDFTKKASSKKLKSVIGWWHSHNTFMPEFSEDDDTTFKRLAEFSDFCFGVVIGFDKDYTKMDMNSRLDIYGRNGDYITMDHVEVEVESSLKKVQIDTDKIMQEVKGLVKVDDRVWGYCPYCNGRGTIGMTQEEMDKLYTGSAYIDDYSLDTDFNKSEKEEEY